MPSIPSIPSTPSTETIQHQTPPTIVADKYVDACGFLCPIPLLHLRRGLVSLEAGKHICLQADDKTTLQDVPFFCQQMGHSLIETHQYTAPSKTSKTNETNELEKHTWYYLIQK